MAKEKLYYKIGEACKVLDIQPYVLRYWETEFSVLSPSKSKSGQRVYSDTDFALIRRIKELLYEEGFTIAGAKKKLEGEIAARGAPKGGEEAADSDEQEIPEAAKAKAGTAASAKERAPDDGEALKAADKQIDRLRSGAEKALSEARELLELLSS